MVCTCVPAAEDDVDESPGLFPPIRPIPRTLARLPGLAEPTGGAAAAAATALGGIGLVGATTPWTYRLSVAVQSSSRRSEAPHASSGPHGGASPLAPEEGEAPEDVVAAVAVSAVVDADAHPAPLTPPVVAVAAVAAHPPPAAAPADGLVSTMCVSTER